VAARLKSATVVLLLIVSKVLDLMRSVYCRFMVDWKNYLHLVDIDPSKRLRMDPDSLVPTVPSASSHHFKRSSISAIN
jgi:hypothetical protein